MSIPKLENPPVKNGNMTAIYSSRPIDTARDSLASFYKNEKMTSLIKEVETGKVVIL